MCRYAPLVALLMLAGFTSRPLSAQSLGNEDLHIEQAEAAVMQSAHDGATDALLDGLRRGERDMLNAYLAPGFGVGGNFAVIKQEGEENVAGVTQTGASNMAVIHQEGSRNVTLLDQIGEGNVFGAWLIGSDNHLQLRQQGRDNVYQLDFVGDNLNHSVQQVGNGIEAYQVGSARQPFGIEQYGSGMSIRIEHNTP